MGSKFSSPALGSEPPHRASGGPGREDGTQSDQACASPSRADFYDWLAKTIRIDGIETVERDAAFDNKTLMSAGIRIFYKTHTQPLVGLRPGVLRELGFDDVAPNTRKDISSWLHDYAVDKVDIIDNRAKGVACYDPEYTFVEKLQTVSRKFRQQQEKNDSPIDFMRHYYDIYALLQRPEVQEFIGTKAYEAQRPNAFAATTIRTSHKTKP